MLELNAIHIAIIAVMTLVGAILGWIIRGKRAAEEKAAVSAGWQEQINAQRTEHDRLTDQNKGLMEQISQYQASNMDAKNRAKELSAAVQEAYGRRDELQREIKDIRGNLEVAMTERDQLQSDMSAKTEDYSVIQRKDAQINKLQLDLENWQNRLPPLIEKFRQRNEDALQLETELAANLNRRVKVIARESNRYVIRRR
jgi:chromosome segregation ATPase